MMEKPCVKPSCVKVREIADIRAGFEEAYAYSFFAIVFSSSHVQDVRLLIICMDAFCLQI